MSMLAVPEMHFRRYRQIAEVLTRHGLRWLRDVSGLERFRPLRPDPGDGARSESLTTPERLRLALEELGATFIKLGQFLSTRADLLPPEYQTELAKLQDSAPPFDSKTAKEMIEAELGQPTSALFAGFDLEPLAAASIGQAHAATLRDGAEVVVKIRRPGVVEQVEEDLEILQNLASAMSRHWEFATLYDVEGLTQEFAQTLRSELNYLQEARNAERFARNFAGDPKVHIPRVFWEMTTSRALTLERIRGVKVSDLDSLKANGIDRRALAERGTEVILKMIFEDGFFHADLHPGNFFIEADGRFGLIDFGMVGSVDDRLQERLSGLLLALAGADYDQLVDALLEIGVVTSRIDRDRLRRDLENLISPYNGRPLGEIALTPLLDDALAIVRRHRMRLPSNLALLLKTIIITEGLGARLDPDFYLLSVIEPYTSRLLLNLYSPARWLRKLKRAGSDMAWLGAEAPQQLRRLIGAIERNGFEVGMRPESFEPLIKRLERIANRIVLGILAAAFIVGLATLLSVYRPPGWENWAGVMFAAGFFFAFAVGIYLAWSILRSGRD
ncbi:MAG TPA: AarF/ABC1/UbiB kinase family protein [Blastocatellia bacterium]|nr:AarF/ABC1/UbiB kinase family protein [Blastocatellia bacterium]